MPKRTRVRLRPTGYFDECLIRAIRKLAKPICKRFNLKPKSLSLFEWDDDFRKSARGICDSSGSIHMDFRTRSLKTFSRIETIVDTLVHELAHLKHLDHSAHFWALHAKMKKWTFDKLINPR